MMPQENLRPRYVFFGTPKFAALTLEHLLRGGYVPSAVICNPDRPIGRKKVITPPPVKQLITNGSWHTEIFQREDVNTIRHALSAMHIDVSIVAAYAKIIPRSILEIPTLGTIGVHPSLLPRYRGSSPIQNVILQGEAETGVTLFLMDERVDHGSILAREKCHIDANDTYETLEGKLATIAGNLLVSILPKFLSGVLRPTAQNESLATYTQKFKTEDGFIDQQEIESVLQGKDQNAVIKIERMIRALNPEPGVWTIRDGKRIKLLRAIILDSRLKLIETQKEGKKARFL